jgi:NAD(P)-dependent dehydrogenase (short-subunit alcohol dehydrogenase family)
MKSAIVTGGNRGIGRAITLRLDRMGYKVLVVHNDGKQKMFTDEDFVFDIRQKGQVALFFEAIVARGFVPTAIVNCAGVASAKKFLSLDVDDFDQMISTNVIGTFLMSQMFARVYGEEIGKKDIINITSVSGLQGFSGHAHYCASKFAVTGMSQVMAKELAKLNIRVNCIAPGPTDTDMWKQLDKEYRDGGFMPHEIHEDDYMSKLIIKRMGTPQDVADAVEYLIHSQYTTGITLPVCGGNIMR